MEKNNFMDAREAAGTPSKISSWEEVVDLNIEFREK